MLHRRNLNPLYCVTMARSVSDGEMFRTQKQSDIPRHRRLSTTEQIHMAMESAMDELGVDVPKRRLLISRYSGDVKAECGGRCQHGMP